MGMDVIGRAPVSETGRYFRNNIWWWRPLWNYCELVAPDIIPESNLGHSNDGWELGHRASVALATRLEFAISEGHAAAYERARQEHLSPSPRNLATSAAPRANGQHRPPLDPVSSPAMPAAERATGLTSKRIIRSA